MAKRDPIVVHNGIAIIPLNDWMWTTVDEADLPLVASRVWTALVGSDGNRLYAVSYAPKPALRMRRAIMSAGQGQLVDHRDGNGLNNRRYNLRIATKAQNNQNREPIKRALPVGVRQINDRFYAQINNSGRQMALGGYATPEEAYAAYVREAAATYGEWLHPSLRTALD